MGSPLVKRQHSHRGFTLIELLVVVVIIGVLAAVALPNLIGQTDKARTTEATSLLSAINTGQEAYFYENLTYVTIGTIGTVTFIPSGGTASAAKGLANGDIIAAGAEMDQNQAATILGVNINASNWRYATTGTLTTWSIASTGTKAPFTNLQAYIEKNLNRTLLDSDNTN